MSVPEDELAFQKHDVLPQDVKNDDISDVTLGGTDAAIEGSADSANIVDTEAPTSKVKLIPCL